MSHHHQVERLHECVAGHGVDEITTGTGAKRKRQLIEPVAIRHYSDIAVRVPASDPLDLRDRSLEDVPRVDQQKQRTGQRSLAGKQIIRARYRSQYPEVCRAEDLREAFPE